MILKFKLALQSKVHYGNLVSVTFESNNKAMFWVETEKSSQLGRFPVYSQELIPSDTSDIRELTSFNLLMTIGKLKHHINRDRIER